MIYLPDKSALARTHLKNVYERFEALAETNELATCGMVDLEVLYSSRNRADFDRVWQGQRSMLRVEIDDGTFRGAVGIMARLADTGRHRRALPDLIIAAAAMQTDVTVLHYDHDFEIIAEVCDLKHEWIVPPGSA